MLTTCGVVGGCARFLPEGIHGARDERGEDILFGPEIEVQGTPGDSRALGDVGDRHCFVALYAQQSFGGVENGLFPHIPFSGCGAMSSVGLGLRWHG